MAVPADVSRCVGVGVRCVWKKQEESERLFFFWSKSHPYNKYFLSIYAFPDTIFLAVGKRDDTCQPSVSSLTWGETDIDRPACEMSRESCFCLGGWGQEALTR